MRIFLLSLFYITCLSAIESTSTYKIEGMMCAVNCPQKVNESLNGLNGIKSCKVDFKTKSATVLYDDDKINSEQIAKIISEGTYFKVEDINKQNKSFSLWNWILGKK